MKSYTEVFNEVDYNKALAEGYRLATNEEIKYYHQNILKGFHTGRVGEVMVKETEDKKTEDDRYIESVINNILKKFLSE